MKHKQLVAAVSIMAGLTLSAPAFSQATLVLGDNTVVTAINGQEVKNGMFSKPQTTFKLAPGKHVITAKYTRLYELQGDNHDILRSNNISLPVELADNQTYRLDMLGQPEAYAAAKSYVKQPTLAVLRGNQVVASQQANNSGSGSIFSGMGSALGGVFGNSNAVAANQQTIDALNGQSGAAIPALSQPALSQPAAAASTDTLDQFMQLWLKATPSEREKIRQWLQK